MNSKLLRLSAFIFLMSICSFTFAQNTDSIVVDSISVSAPLTPGQQYRQAYENIMSFEGLDTEAVINNKDLFFEYITSALRKGDLYRHMATEPVGRDYKPYCLVSFAELNKNGVKIPYDPQHYAHEYKISQIMAEDLARMFKDAAKAGYKIRVCSAYRSYEYQIQLIEKFREANLSAYVAAPGKSEHCLGLACDIEGPTKPYINTKECRWTMSNCEKYGFALTMPPGGFPAEPWHYRYIGAEGVAFKNTFFFGKAAKMLRFVSEHRKDIAALLEADAQIRREQRETLMRNNLRDVLSKMVQENNKKLMENVLKPINLPKPEVTTIKRGRR